MSQRLTELVDAIVRMLADHPDSRVSESTVRSWLKGQGYAKRDIDAAMKLARPQLTRKHNEAVCTTRPLSLYEQHKLAPTTRDALARLEGCGLITPDERELVLEHLCHMDGPVGIEELDYLLNWLICSTRDVEYRQTLANVLDNHGGGLH